MSDQSDIAVSARGLVKRFGDNVAVDGIDLDIRRGEIFGFLGPNGAGKTTTIKVLTTLIPPTAGTVEIDGRPLSGMDDPVKSRIGTVQQNVALDRDMTVEDNIRYHAMLHRMPREQARERMDAPVDRMGLTPYMDREVIDLSGGWKRRVAIVCSMIHDP